MVLLLYQETTPDFTSLNPMSKTKKRKRQDFSAAKSIVKESASGAAGGYLVGRKHSEGGIKVINKSDPSRPVEVQGGEAVITAPALSDNTLHDFEGKKMTKRQILSAINVDAGGVSFAEGGRMKKKIKVRYCHNKQYRFGGKMMEGKDIVSDCGCQHKKKTQGTTLIPRSFYMANDRNSGPAKTKLSNGGEIPQLAEKYNLIQTLIPTTIPEAHLTKDTAESIYKALPNTVNRLDGMEIRFVNNAFGKIVRDRNSRLVLDTIPFLSPLISSAVPIYFEITHGHKKSRMSIIGFHNYLNKISFNSTEYYVRITAHEKTKSKHPNELHSLFISDIHIEKAMDTTVNLQGHFDLATSKHPRPLTDTKLQNWLEKAKAASLKFEKGGKIKKAQDSAISAVPDVDQILRTSADTKLQKSGRLEDTPSLFGGLHSATNTNLEKGGDISDKLLDDLSKIELSAGYKMYEGHPGELLKYVQDQATGLSATRDHVDTEFTAYYSVTKMIGSKDIVLRCVAALPEKEKRKVMKAWKGKALNPELRKALRQKTMAEGGAINSGKNTNFTSKGISNEVQHILSGTGQNSNEAIIYTTAHHLRQGKTASAKDKGQNFNKKHENERFGPGGEINQSDQELAEKYELVQHLNPTLILAEEISKDQAEQIYKGLGSAINVFDQHEIKFSKSVFGKLISDKNREAVLKSIPQLKEIITGAIPIYTELERNRKKHPNIFAYHNYLNKIDVDNKLLYVRITAEELKSVKIKEADNLHALFISDIKIIGGEEPKPSRISNRVFDFSIPLVDTKLQNWLENAKAASLKFQSGGKIASVQNSLLVVCGAYQQVARTEKKPVNTLSEAVAVCKTYIDDWDLGGSTWTGGQVYDINGKLVAYVSYNGRVWEQETAPGKKVKEITGARLSKKWYKAGGLVGERKTISLPGMEHVVGNSRAYPHMANGGKLENHNYIGHKTKTDKHMEQINEQIVLQEKKLTEIHLFALLHAQSIVSSYHCQKQQIKKLLTMICGYQKDIKEYQSDLTGIVTNYSDEAAKLSEAINAHKHKFFERNYSYPIDQYDSVSDEKLCEACKEYCSILKTISGKEAELWGSLYEINVFVITQLEVFSQICDKLSSVKENILQPMGLTEEDVNITGSNYGDRLESVRNKMADLEGQKIQLKHRADVFEDTGIDIGGDVPEGTDIRLQETLQ